MARTLSVIRESWPLASVFRISRGARTASEVIVVEIVDGASIGRGECFPYARYGESLDSVEVQIWSVAGVITRGAGVEEIGALLPAGAARNAVDCALWDLEAKLSGRRVWDLVGLADPGPVTTVYTLGVDTPEAMASKAAENRNRPRLKLKMTGDDLDLERVGRIHVAAPKAGLIVDANEGWTVAQYLEHAPRLAALGVEMIEQPLLDALSGKYDMINIKLDKTGGLTEALRLREAALAAGFGVMVGCMIGTSLAMAPAMLVAQGVEVVDLDGPLLLARDRDPGLDYDGSIIAPPSAKLWG
jgi:L-alanine-DL-glutamate epimerase-like enolase superfamily enzyme